MFQSNQKMNINTSSNNALRIDRIIFRREDMIRMANIQDNAVRLANTATVRNLLATAFERGRQLSHSPILLLSRNRFAEPLGRPRAVCLFVCFLDDRPDQVAIRYVNTH